MKKSDEDVQNIVGRILDWELKGAMSSGQMQAIVGNLNIVHNRKQSVMGDGSRQIEYETDLCRAKKDSLPSWSRRSFLISPSSTMKG